MTRAVKIAADAGQVRELGIGRLIAEAFDHMDANRYLAGDDPAERLAVMSLYFGMLAEHVASGAGQVLYIGEGSASVDATAVWFDLTVEPPPLPDYEQQLAAITGDHLPRFQALDEALNGNHPQEDKHWYLAFLAVRPGRWRQGLGSALIAHTHAELDQAGTAAYLEATDPENARLYQDHGYDPVEPFEIKVGPVTFFPMWRTPQGAA
ncbi:GNAT family N-acetyltransferase [Actinoplanes derwentensis]|uniref:Acetyltransferase (GNAT) domain-containing protein n=1 Tax=Actinoplanes derwentensis TaxID=113562 RepID=A0A1H2CVT2_9ACTN|nr:GNAT family N-acetyltransferase [Actinoplanes derwentensis]GID82053.1 GCN5-like N-acetyltransferase [Actinoplanes derwentensis]SDT74484.1 Acetyltransferase (GNAT) domain-containing protein [Actinoplanes derwentensis]